MLPRGNTEDEQERTKQRALGDAFGQRSSGGGAVVDADELLSACEISAISYHWPINTNNTQQQRLKVLPLWYFQSHFAPLHSSPTSNLCIACKNYLSNKAVVINLLSA